RAAGEVMAVEARLRVAEDDPRPLRFTQPLPPFVIEHAQQLLIGGVHRLVGLLVGRGGFVFHLRRALGKSGKPGEEGEGAQNRKSHAPHRDRISSASQAAARGRRRKRRGVPPLSPVACTMKVPSEPMNPISEKLASLSEKISAAGVKLEHL